MEQPAVQAAAPAPGPELVHMEVAKAVMVTVELDYGATPVTIAQALADVIRVSSPDDKQGRTFAILDAYGEKTPDGKLHMSMHISSEKPGSAELRWKRTGETLWRARIDSSGGAPNEKALKIYVDDGKGNSRLLDGSKNPPTIMDATVNDLKVPLRDYWPEGAEREVTFVYSACGCPVKVKARRAGNATARTSDLPVIFPDDPQAAVVIGKLMGW
ncbi:MAG TPA: hypothetical protein PLF26_13805 [Blastocatellia bacterium]|nr:hypothetical protein [Blastocatellia bacterium]